MTAELNVIPVETDVLIIGGGLAGCMAGIKAAESDIRVTITDKSNTEHSGCAGSGIDHLTVTYIPPVHERMGWTIEDLVEDHAQFSGGFIRRDLCRLAASTMYDRMLDLEKFGINFRYEDSKLPGKFRVVEKRYGVPNSFNFDGRLIKAKLTKEAKKRGVDILNRVMVTDLLSTDGQISGALGVNTRTGDIYFFKAKAVVLSTGRSNRLSRNLNGFEGNLPLPFPMSGDGKAMAFRAGLELINMEFLGGRALATGGVNQPAGGAPRGTWLPATAVVDETGKVITPRTQFPDWEKLFKGVDAVAARKERVGGGRGPSPIERVTKGEGLTYLDVTGGTEEEIKYIEWSLSNEGKCWAFLEHLKEEGVDLRKDKIEYVSPSNRALRGQGEGIVVDENLETELKGLFAAGDEVGGLPMSSGAGAVTEGWYAGDMAAKRAQKQASLLPVNEDKLKSYRESCSEMLATKKGHHWREVELAVQDIIDFYRGDVMSEPILRRGLERLDEVKARASLKARNPHELGRCLDVKSIIDNAEMTMRASLERKESRRRPVRFERADYPEQDDKNWFCFLAISKKDGEFKFTKYPLDK